MTARLLLFALLLEAVLLTNTAFRHRQIMRKVDERVSAVDRFVDVRVQIVTVAADEHGEVLIENKPKMRIVGKPIVCGGIIDTQSTPPRLITGASSKPIERVWYVSEDQAVALFHDNPAQLAQLVYGSEGAGKTRLLCMWHYIRWLGAIGKYREGGQTAPTLKRLGLVTAEFAKLFAPNWYRVVKRDDFEGLELCDGTRIRLVSTYRQSAHQGSPIQGFNWDWCGRDEMQDSVYVHEDCESRGRSAPVENGVVMYRQLATATAKDSSDWRELRDRLLAGGAWIKRELSIFRAPFVAPSFLVEKRKTLSPREFARRYGDPKTGVVGDLPPELAVYYAWLRSRNLTHRPRIATDVTAALLRDYRSYCRPGAGFSILCSHDPGAIYNTTEILRLLVYPYERRENGRLVAELVPTWAVVGELQTEQTTQRDHAIALKRKLQDEFGVDFNPTRDNPQPGAKACIFVDPHGKGEADTDYQSVYMAFNGVGLDAFNPAPMTGKIRRSPRIEMVNRLLGGTAESERPRLVVFNDLGVVAAPRLVEAFESLRKDPGAKNPEGNQIKDAHDKTHAPAALAYGLWPFEQEAFTAETIKRAIAEARRIG